MDFYGIPFVYRLLILLAVLCLVGGIDLLLHRQDATRWREYLFLVACGTLGAAVGVSTDAVTSQISPEYFIVGKGVPDGDGFTARVLLLGAHAGFFAGAVAAMCCLIANNPRRGLPAVSYPMLARIACIPLALALSGGWVAGVTLFLGAAGSLVSRIDVPVAPERAEEFIVAWGTHGGLYAGLLAGVVIAVLRVRRARRLLVELVEPPSPVGRAGASR